LFFCAGAGLTELASAWLMQPGIGKRLTLGSAEQNILNWAPPAAGESAGI
jgi:hypothetical protein